MSSVFLYVAIVAIWAFVLVPRWLHHHHAQPQSDAEDYFYDDFVPELYDDVIEPETGLPPEETRPANALANSRKPSARPRSHMMQARRRLLTVLVILAAAAGALVEIKVAPWWVCVPPAIVLCIYLLLLREAARADAERAQRRATVQARHARRRAAALGRALQAARAQSAQTAERSADVIDISARRDGQVYDQYADAGIRAMGD
ncbi:MAG: hypothetical protein J2P27_00860 [Actinobacteria bacterium]|nr:hypothetical protein [Actinomycetota bacterium]